MHPARIAELLEPFVSSIPDSEQDRRSGEESAVLSPTQLQHISTYIDILLRWNARLNLTAIRDPEEIVTRHFGESLFAAHHLFPATAIGSCDAHVGTAALGCPAERSSAQASDPEDSANDHRPLLACPERSEGTNDVLSAADLGSGAGFPGVPIKLWAPRLTLTLIESNQKKTAFLREIIRALTLTNVNVFPGRAEQLLQQPLGPALIHEEDPSLTSDERGQPERTKPRQSKRGRHKPAGSDRRPRPGQFAPPAATPAGGQPPSRQPAGFDLVTLRAVERFANVLPVAASLVSPGGRLALLIGASQLDQAQASLPTLAWDPPLPVPQSQSRILLIARRS